VTREEKHSTRGRAHLLWEMMNGELELWRSREVLEALDLCLSCKGCTSECPVNVDMPTLKAEFLAHHYRRRLRPRHAYAFGLIDRWAQIASHAPRLANLVTQTRGLSAVAKAVGGVSQERRLPAFAPRTFRSWFAAHSPTEEGMPVILWPDTFTNHFEPQVGVAAVRVLESAGFAVRLPRGRLCCGRPLYDYGFLGLARSYLERTVASLRADIRRGTPVVGLEPSCVAVFRDELTKLIPHDEDAKRLAKQTFHLAEFLCEHAEGYRAPAVSGRIVLHGHCHARATGGFEHERRLLEQTGAAVDVPDSGCCGMAGAWGYERAHHDVSRACAERVLLPAVRDAAPGTPIVASGFSCRSQIEQLGPGRKAVHVVELLDAAESPQPAFRRSAAGGHARREPPRPRGRDVARRGR
jgi:Fe-S oxidoreductase